MNTHTSGPWRIWRDMDPKEPLSIVGPSDDFCCTMEMENTQAQANARLIAAAPDLLAALQEAIAAVIAFEDYCSQFENHGSSPRLGKWKEQARLAINKAQSL